MSSYTPNQYIKFLEKQIEKYSRESNACGHYKCIIEGLEIALYEFKMSYQLWYRPNEYWLSEDLK